LSTNKGSLESLKVSERCGSKPNAVQIPPMFMGEKPLAAANEQIG